MLEFADSMSPHVPTFGVFTVKYDGLPAGATVGVTWVDDKHLAVLAPYVIAHPTATTISYDGSDPLFKTTGIDIVGTFSHFALTEI